MSGCLDVGLEGGGDVSPAWSRRFELLLVHWLGDNR